MILGIKNINLYKSPKFPRRIKMAHEQVTKAKKKQWFPIVAPKQFEEAVIGETLVYDPESMIGKTLSHNLMNLTDDIKRQNINIHFKVTELDNNRAKTTIIGYEIMPSSVKRFVRRNSEKVDLSFACDTADNVFLRIKPLIVTRADVKGSVAAKLRHNVVRHLTAAIKKLKYDELINELISHKIQSEMRAVLNKIYPVKVCEIRYLGLEQADKQEAKEAVVVEAKAE